MLPTKWVVFLAAFWVVGSLICGLMEGAWLGPGEESVIESVMECKLFTSEDITGRIAGAFSGTLWSGLLNMASWNYGIFYGTWELVRWILLMPLTIVVVYSVILQTARLIRGGG